MLIYVTNKARAFSEFLRVLRPGGRVSLFEPINRFGMAERREGFWAIQATGCELAARVDHVYEEIQPPSDPMLDFDERDLVKLAEGAGFFPVELDLHAVVRPSEPRPWEAFVNSSGNPKIPTIGEAMDQALNPRNVSGSQSTSAPSSRKAEGLADGARLPEGRQALVHAVPAATPACHEAQRRA